MLAYSHYPKPPWSAGHTRSENEDSCIDWSMEKRGYIYKRWYPLQGSLESGETRLKLMSDMSTYQVIYSSSTKTTSAPIET